MAHLQHGLLCKEQPVHIGCLSQIMQGAVLIADLAAIIHAAHAHAAREDKGGGGMGGVPEL
eukprot:1161325-Pelagomonas_calceolata.AAC.1